jgi:hypothetical protein
MLGSRLASTEKVTNLDFSRRSAGRHVSLVQDEDAAIVVAAEKPSVAVLAAVNLALVVRHCSASNTSTKGDPHSFPRIEPYISRLAGLHSACRGEAALHMLVEGFSVFGIQVQYWMLIVGAMMVIAIVAVLRAL